jgi:hypothetical protein
MELQPRVANFTLQIRCIEIFAMNPDKFRREAAAAQEKADNARNDQDRATWLRIAQSWMNMLRSGEKTRDQEFEEHVEKKGTRQERSDESH